MQHLRQSSGQVGGWVVFPAPEMLPTCCVQQSIEEPAVGMLAGSATLYTEQKMIMVIIIMMIMLLRRAYAGPKAEHLNQGTPRPARHVRELPRPQGRRAERTQKPVRGPPRGTAGRGGQGRLLPGPAPPD